MTDASRLQPRALEPLGPDAPARLERHLRMAVRRARSRGVTVLVSVTAQTTTLADPVSAITASRGASEPWFGLEQPDRDGLAIAGVGCVQAIEAAGPGRFTAVADRWRELRADAEIDTLDGPPGSGLAAFGGFAFAPDGGASPDWHGYPPGSMIVPEVSLARQSGATWLTVNAQFAPDDTPEDVTARMAARLQSLRADPLPLFDPHPTGRYEVASPMPPAHYEEAVARAVQRIRAGEFEKVVLAREVDVHAPAAHDPAAVFALLRAAVRELLHLRRGPRRHDVHRRQPRAAHPPTGPARDHGGARRLGSAQRRPGRRRPPGRAADALRQGPRGERDRRAPDRPRR